MSDKPKNPLLAKEDWWTVWFGMIILLVATGLGIMHLSDVAPKYSVPKLGKWVSSPLDTFSYAKKVEIDVNKGDKKGVETLTLQGLADSINKKGGKANAEAVIEQAEGGEGVVLRVFSTREGAKETISFKALLDDGDAKLKMSSVDKDPGGLGAPSLACKREGRLGLLHRRKRTNLPSDQLCSCTVAGCQPLAVWSPKEIGGAERQTRCGRWANARV